MRYLTLLLLFFNGCHSLIAQINFDILKGAKKVDIPFEYKNDLILVDVTFQQIFQLKFIFDTGAENTILSKKEFTQILQIPFERRFTLFGADLRTELTAYLIRNIHLKMGNMILPHHSMLVLEEDYLRFEEMAGLEIHGILGADIFRGMVVSINYDRKVITLTRSSEFEPPKDFEHLPLEIHRNKAYLNTTLEVVKGEPQKVKLLLDSGAMVSLLLSINTDSSLQLPPNVLKGNLAAGLGGFIEGYIGRVAAVSFGEYECNEVLTNFQDLTEVLDTSILHGRNGIIGNKLLSRFHVIIDYPGGNLYCRPNRKFKERFEFDKSGLVVIAADVRLNRFIIHDLIPGSPGAEAGLLPGDEIVRVNGLSAQFLTLLSIHRRFRSKTGREVCVVVKRGKTRVKMKFKLRQLI